MKKINQLILSLLALVSLSSNAAFNIPHYEKITLDNGLQVFLMVQSEVPLIDVILTTKAGAIYDQKSFGLAHISGEAQLFGSGQHSKTEIEDQLAFIGAEMNVSTGTEMSALSLSFASKDLQQMLPLLKDVAVNPSFDQQEFDKFKTRYLNQLIESRQSPRDIIGNLFARSYYAEHPYGNPVSGDTSTVEKIDLTQVKAFHQRFYTPTNSALVIVGDFDISSMKAQVNELFSTWQGKSTKAMTLPPVAAPTQSNVWLVNKEDATETTFIIGGKGMAANHPDSVAAEVINTILGGRFTSWLNDALRVDSGLTYGARSRFDDKAYAGSFYISTFTKTETTFEAIDLALQTYQKIWNKGIDKATLESAKAYVKGQFPPLFETSKQLASLLSRMWALNLDTSYINEFEQKVDALDIKSANALARELFPRENLQFILVGKASEIKDQAKKYGKLKELEIKTFEY